MQTFNVGFYCPSVDYSRRRIKNYKTTLVVGTAPYYLHGYFKKHYPEYAKYFLWKPSLLYYSTEEKILNYLNEYDVDILCISLYIWNVLHVMESITNIKQKYKKNLKIVIGGPSCDAAKKNWESNYTFVDHFVVGQGEKAWTNIALNLLNVKKIETTDTNIVHIVKKGEKVAKQYEYEFVRGIHYSPFMECGDMIDELRQKYEPNEIISWPYETQRGCPYHCTFCDWNGGQTNKTQKRKEINFKDEIDFFAEHKMWNLSLADANWGMWDVDLEITKHIIWHNEHNGGKFKIYSYNMSKILNNNHKEIFRLFLKHDLVENLIYVAQQDIHQNVLKAIDRPGNWEEMKKFALELYAEFAESKKKNKIFVQIILGLPEQTPESYIETMDEVYGNGMIAGTFPFFILENAPAGSDLEYRNKYGIKDDLIFETLQNNLQGENIKDVFNNPLNNNIYRQIISCNSFSTLDFVRMTCIDNIYRVLFSKTAWPAYGLIDKNWIHLQQIVHNMMKTDDFEYIIKKRHENFIKYKINAMDSPDGKIILHHQELMSVISRNWHIISDIFENPNMNIPDKNIFLSEWEKFKGTKHLIDR